MKILEFKTISSFFELCRDGKKPFDIRLFDYHDKRFRALSQWNHLEGAQWGIKFTNPATGQSYIREFKDWRYLFTPPPNSKWIRPYWIIMYLGKLLPTPGGKE